MADPRGVYDYDAEEPEYDDDDEPDLARLDGYEGDSFWLGDDDGTT
jgi:hypothetical protein